MLLARINRQLEAHGIQITPGGELTTRLLSKQMVKLYDSSARPTDAQLHAFIDEVTDIPSTPPSVSSPSSSRPNLLPRLFGAVKMIARKINRRAALIGLTSALAGVSLGHYILSPAPSNPQTQQANPQYVEPTWWDSFAEYDRKQMLAWDFVFWQVENQTPIPTTAPPILTPFNAMGSLIVSTMTQAGQHEFKKLITAFIADSHRWQYFPHLLPALTSGNEPMEVRLAIVGAARRIFQTTGTQAFTTEVQQALVAAYNLEPSLFVKNRLDALLTLLGVPH